MDLSNEGFEVTEQPTITVDTDYDVMPEAVVGKSYPVPTATAHDLYSDDVEVNVNVWYRRTTGRRCRVQLRQLHGCCG